MIRRTICTLTLGFFCAAFTASAQNLDNFKGCPREGTAKSKCGKALNRLKNRYKSPAKSAINEDITLEAILEPGDDRKRWSTSDAAVVEGIVANVLPGGFQESCNCGREDLRDFHIDLILDKKDKNDKERHVVAEITPRMQELHPKWTTKFIRSLKGKRVRFTGWMLFDGMHSAESFNTQEFAQQCGSIDVKEIWRATAWEIHPITSIAILK